MSGLGRTKSGGAFGRSVEAFFVLDFFSFFFASSVSSRKAGTKKNEKRENDEP